MSLPCKDCICLAICKGSYLQLENNAESEIDSVVSICCKCTMLHDYIFKDTTSYQMIKHEDIFDTFMKGTNNEQSPLC